MEIFYIVINIYCFLKIVELIFKYIMFMKKLRLVFKDEQELVNCNYQTDERGRRRKYWEKEVSKHLWCKFYGIDV